MIWSPYSQLAHMRSFFFQRWPDLVVVLRCDHTKPWERLEIRSFMSLKFRITDCLVGYLLKKKKKKKKFRRTTWPKFMQVVLEEARSSYPLEIFVEFKSEGMEQLESNVTRIIEWITAWLKNQENSRGSSM